MVIPYNPQLGCDLYCEGYFEGAAEVIVRVLKRHGIEVSPAQREQITECTEVEFLDIWIDQALDGTQLSDFTELDEDTLPQDGDAVPEPIARQTS